ncbi:hypothetical protein HYALB_00008885 [Hymenoscyphus albidus]|uniref:Uncharacterized protein n=1 Tax=Hymenoscyphus albidus TaxID=595503 RepID=A0A9N9Q721_9HELO|nr:hypothetical protein HYALB_00008885 [Hymenoscyphus albidus]
MSSNAPHLHHHHLQEEELSYGPFGFLNPTIRRVPLSFTISHQISSSGNVDQSSAKNTAQKGQDVRQDQVRSEGMYREFRTRDNRKGRHALALTPQTTTYLTPPRTTTPSQTLLGISRMFTSYPYWDISYLVTVIFTLGSVVWCINAFFVYLPLQIPSSEFGGEIANAGGY